MRRSIFIVVGICMNLAYAGVIETVAGSGEQGSIDGHALQAKLDNPFGVIRGPDGALWFCEYTGHAVRRIDGEGNVTTVVIRSI